MARMPLLAGNWKMHKDHLEAIQLVQQIAYHLDEQDYDRSEIVVIPPFTALRSIQTLIDGDRLAIGLGAQDCYPEDSGAFTGAISPVMLAKLAVRYVVCGHSERRHIFGDDDQTVNRKVQAVLANGMRPILCVGETDEEREQGQAEEIVARHVIRGLDGVAGDRADDVVIAYEPVWAIGTGKTATPSDANEMCGFARSQVAEVLGGDAAVSIRVQYGGSVKPGNVAELMAQSEIDGALVGGASLQADDFAAICRYHRL
jgi:triosephosphate isomerase